MGTLKTNTAKAVIDPVIQKQAECILKEIGLSAGKSVELFYRQVVAQRGLPFELHVPNKKTAASLVESECEKDTTTFGSPLKMFKYLGLPTKRVIKSGKLL